MAAVSAHGEAIQNAAAWKKDDFHLALAAVKNRGGSLMFLSKRLKDNERIVHEAVKDQPRAIKFASGRVQHVSAEKRQQIVSWLS